ncbi:hypothetical protein SKAU_G00060790 [Synaphobranchus kaupii]|uniref:Uncharacterized protein n=1 Tax=Synaphobranchus kaupii TaxID=118154 RepID=A0A9Q1G4U5_SYNKA|nr:hypothetical protein SKAU_G00060790 [Synaphobranchus kaupii]
MTDCSLPHVWIIGSSLIARLQAHLGAFGLDQNLGLDHLGWQRGQKVKKFFLGPSNITRGSATIFSLFNVLLYWYLAVKQYTLQITDQSVSS